MRKLTFVCLGIITNLMISCQGPMLPEFKAANDILSAIASGDVTKFNWLSVEDVATFRDCQDREELEDIVRHKNESITPQLRDWRHKGEEIGIDWNSYVLDGGDFEEEYDESLSIYSAKGYIHVTSNDKQFDIRFNHVVIMPSGEWKFIDIRNFELAEPEVDNDVKLIQDKDFETFVSSLADCFAGRNESEIEKIVLCDDKGVKVIKDVSMNTVDYMDVIQGDSFKEFVKNKHYTSEEQYSAQLLEWLVGYSLDEDEIFNESLVYELKIDEGLSGIYFLYKGNWYLWQMY